MEKEEERMSGGERNEGHRIKTQPAMSSKYAQVAMEESLHTQDFREDTPVKQ